MARPDNGSTELTVKKTRKSSGPRTPKPVAFVAIVKDSAGAVVQGAVIEKIVATKDVAEAFKQHKANPGSDMFFL